MQKFNIGDYVRCINTSLLRGNDIAPSLKMGGLYTVMNIVEDSKGNQHLDVGLVSSVNYIRSWETKEELPDGNKIHWCHPSRFELS